MDEKEVELRYPTIYDFLETVFWDKADGANLLEVLHRVLVRAHPQRAERFGDELRGMANDKELREEELVELFGRGANHPFLVVGMDNARDVLYCLGEYMDYLLDELRKSGV